MQISVVIPTHFRPAGLADLLSSLTDQKDVQFEVHVIANLEDDPGRQAFDKFAGRFSHLHWHVVGQKGVNRARNRGLEVARAPVALFLDDDCRVPHAYFLRDTLELHAREPDSIAVGGGYFTPLAASTLSRAYNLISTRWLLRESETGQTVNLLGGNVSYKLEPLRKADLRFNGDIVFGGAETDFHLRLVLAGKKLHFAPDLNVEHRVEIGARAFLRKAFLQGYGARKRWQQGLYVRSRYLPEAQTPRGGPRELRWQRRFDRAFEWGQVYARLTQEPTTRLGLIGRITAHLAQNARKRFKDVLQSGLKRSGFSSADRVTTSLAMSRPYVLPVSRTCRFTCGQCDQLGLKKVSGEFTTELRRAKAFGFQEVLLPCNALFEEKRDHWIREIEDQGLRPVLLVNGDRKTPVATGALDQVPMSTGFHLLLGPASDYQDALVTYLAERDRDFSVTHFYQDKKSSLEILKRAPVGLANKIHFLFPAIGNLWHARPSCPDMHRHLKRAEKATRGRYRLHVRGPAGAWPVDRGLNRERETWPLLEAKIARGQASAKIAFSIVIPTFNSGEHLLKVLRSLGRQRMDGNRFEIIVVDDGSGDGTEALLRARLPELLSERIHFQYFGDEPDFRAGLIRNVGVSHSRGEFLCFLDSDILVPPDYLRTLESEFQKYDVLQARREMLTVEASRGNEAHKPLAPADTYADDAYWEAFKASESWAALYKHWKYTCTYGLSVRRSLFKRAGWFLPDFFTYGFEDVDLGYRLYRLGARFALSASVVHHLYPERRVMNYHFDQIRRRRALTLSSRVFYRQRLDPEIYQEFYPAYYHSLVGELKLYSSQKYWEWRHEMSEKEIALRERKERYRLYLLRLSIRARWTGYHLASTARGEAIRRYWHLHTPIVSAFIRARVALIHARWALYHRVMQARGRMHAQLVRAYWRTRMTSDRLHAQGERLYWSTYPRISLNVARSGLFLLEIFWRALKPYHFVNYQFRKRWRQIRDA